MNAQRHIPNDALGRPLTSLRISVTDRCNLRCVYCMPEKEYTWTPRQEILTFEELSRLADLFLEIGVRKIRLTGGEPLLRKDLSTFIHILSQKSLIEDLALTTNGILLKDLAKELYKRGLHRITVSLDTLKPDRFQKLTGNGLHHKVSAGIHEAKATGFKQIKINSVIMKGINDDEILDLLEFGKQICAEVRFIEYMDVGGATQWSVDQVFTRNEMLELIQTQYGKVSPLSQNPQNPKIHRSPADRFALVDGTIFGIISSTTAPFCQSCDRSRITADGIWYLCLYARDGVDLKQMLRSGIPDKEIKATLVECWKQRRDRGAEERLRINDRGPLFHLAELKKNPHLEMHLRGG